MRIHRNRVGLLASAMLLIGAGTGRAADPRTMGTAPADDRRFATMAANDGMLETKLGEYAAQNAANPRVREFGQKMSSDHGNANQKLQSLAQESGIKLPTQLEPESQAKLDKLTRLKGAEFDGAYMKEMVADHEKAVKAFQKEAADHAQTRVDRWAADTLPTLKAHLEDAKSIQKQLESRASSEPTRR